MFDILIRQPRRAAVVLGTVALLAAAYLLLVIAFNREQNAGNIGALLDDTWIHVRFASSIANGDGLSYNDGVLTSGATSPLWVMLLAVPIAIFQPDVMQQVDIAIYMSALGHVLTSVAITAFGWWVSRRAWVGFAAGLLTVLTGRFIWMGLTGMEITAFTLLCILAVWSHMHDVRVGRSFGWRTGILLALATLARPEAYLLTVLVGLDAFIFVQLRDHRRFAAVVDAFNDGWRGIVGYVLLAGSYPVANLIIDGYPLPNTFRAKSYLGQEYPDLPDALLWMANQDHGVLFILMAAIGVLMVSIRMFRKQADSGLHVLWAPIFILAVLYLGAERYVVNHSRYVAPSIPFVALSVVLGVQALRNGARQLLTKQKLHHRILQIAMLLLFGVLAVGTFTRGISHGAQVANDTKQLRAMHVQAGYWFTERTTPEQIIALNDVGAIVHISDREVLDLEGLVSPEVIDATNDEPEQTCAHDLELARLIMQEEVRFVGIFPWWYPCLSSLEALQPETLFTITGPTVLGGGEMVIYFPIWEQWPMQLAIDAAATPVDIAYEDGIVLGAFEVALAAEDELVLTLWWQADAQPRRDYHVFVHVVGDDGAILQTAEGRSVQSDGVPQQFDGFAFQTSWWRAGDIIPDEHRISLVGISAGVLENASLNVGLYPFPEPQRLQRRDGQGDVINLPLNIRTMARDVAQ